MDAKRRTFRLLRKAAFVFATLLAGAAFSGFSVWAESELDQVDFAVLTYYCVRQIPQAGDRDWVYLEHRTTHTSQRGTDSARGGHLP